MTEFISTILPIGTLILNILFIPLVIVVSSHKSWGREVTSFLGRHALKFALLASLLAISGSLFYSEIRGFTPCTLCWWQRIGHYSLVLILAVALYHKDNRVFKYVVTLAGMAGLIAAYHQFVYLGGKSILPCTALGGACSKIYVMAFGYITIPMMSLTIALYILLFAWAHKIYNRENRNS